MAATIQDVAQEANVSTATVSRAFNDKPGITSKTRKKVFDAAKRVGYVPKVKNDIKNVGVLFSNRLGSLTTDPFYGRVMEGLEKGLSQKHYHLFFKTITGDYNQDYEVLNELINDKELSGIILIGHTIKKQFVMKLKEKKIPLVLVDNDLWDENIDCVVNDNMGGAKRIVSHLIDIGRKRIGFIGGPLTHISLEERYIGYKQALKENNIEKDKDFIKFSQPTFDAEDGYREAKNILQLKKKHPDAIFAANDMLACGVARAISEAGLVIPDDICLVGFDDIRMASLMSPPLTTVRIFKEEMGQLAGYRLNNLINGINVKPIKLVVSVEKVIRDSTLIKKNDR
ncbi:MAG: LacI family DNA-binding transcriptional regulator [bacterium]